MAPVQIVEGPDTGEGRAETLITSVAMQPPGSVKVISAVPEDIPVTNPVKESMAAMTGEPEFQTPDIASVRSVFAPAQTLPTPVIGEGAGLTLIVFAVGQPKAK
jgi:hypothetical protein